MAKHDGTRIEIVQNGVRKEFVMKWLKSEELYGLLEKDNEKVQGYIWENKERHTGLLRRRQNGRVLRKLYGI